VPIPAAHSRRESPLKIQTILVPVADAGNPRRLVREAAGLARRLHADIILLHVVTAFDYPAGLLEKGDEITARDWQKHVVRTAEHDLDRVHEPELDGLAVTRLLLRGDPAEEILKAASERNAGLIMMSTVGSVTQTVLRECDCPVWTCAHQEPRSETEWDNEQAKEFPAEDFSIRRVLCSLELANPHSRFTLAAAAEWAATLGAVLTLAHITTSVEKWGPGGTLVDKPWRDELVGIATQEIASLQHEAGTNAEVMIDSGEVTELLNLAAIRARADLLIIGHLHGRSHLGDNDNGYELMRESGIPVLSL
jgi:nucleotide-binding universal stress UspA family protein